jgi:hypothetical protein
VLDTLYKKIYLTAFLFLCGFLIGQFIFQERLKTNDGFNSLSILYGATVFDIPGNPHLFRNLLNQANKPILIFVTSTGCSTCLDSVVLWNELYSELNQTYHIIGLVRNDNMDLLDLLIEKGDFKFDIFQIDNPTFLEMKLITIPSYILVESINGNYHFIDVTNENEFKF